MSLPREVAKSPDWWICYDIWPGPDGLLEITNKNKEHLFPGDYRFKKGELVVVDNEPVGLAIMYTKDFASDHPYAHAYCTIVTYRVCI